MDRNSEPFDPYYIWLGIPPDQQPPNHYRLLGLQSGETDLGVVQNAIDRMKRHIQSFAAGEHRNAAEQVLADIATAATCLLHPRSKAGYDSQLQAELRLTPETRATTLVAQPVTSTSSVANSIDQDSATAEVEEKIAVAQVVRPKSNPAWEAGKIVLGGLAGVVLAVLLLQFGLGVRLFGGGSDEVADADLVEEQVDWRPVEKSSQPNSRAIANDDQRNAGVNEQKTGMGGTSVKSPDVYTSPINPATHDRSPEPKTETKVVESKPKRQPKKRRRRRRPRRRKSKPKPKKQNSSSSPDTTVAKANKSKLEDPTKTLHEWVADDGSFRHQAYFQVLTKTGSLKLELEDGTKTSVLVAQLREEDRSLAERLQVEKNKFDVEEGLSASFRLFELKKVKEGALRLRRTAAIDQTDLRANFWLALFSEVIDRRHQSACTYFYKCLKADATHVPTLNNLAVAEIRSRRYESAVKHLSEAAQQQMDVPELVHNVFKLQMEVNNKRIRVPKTAQRRLAAVHSQMQSLQGLPAFDNRRGWKFIGLPGRDLRRLQVSLEDRRCFTCDGTDRKRCPIRICKRGLVPVKKKKRVGRTKTGRAIYNYYTVREKCKKCRGKGHVACPNCYRGEDKAIR